MKKKLSLFVVLVLVLAMSSLVLTGCGSLQGKNLEDYMKAQPAARSSVDAQFSILSPDAKGTVSYTADNKAEVVVQYYAMTDEEIQALEPDKAEVRSKSILKPVLEQFEKDTGNKAEVVVEVEGHVVE
ncbi:MAG: hypothetical protein MJ161_06825 [Clostridia bacterium]|nr:hypothetical protein [Clostridia bacterium]